jgi:pimeloyl-ACP methyl ester carboxylesterase
MSQSNRKTLNSRTARLLSIFLLGVFLINATWYGTARAAKPSEYIIFIPGLLGTQLADGKGNVIWGDLFSYFRFKKLKLSQGEGSDTLHPIDVVKNIQILGPFVIHQYDGLLDTLEELGFKKKQKLFIFKYDWRKSNFDSAKELKRFVDDNEVLKGQKFSIVAHSMGGLVARIYINRYGGATGVDRLLTLGTPHLGSLKAYRMFMEGLSGLPRSMALASDEQIRSVIFSFPSLYELLPAFESKHPCCILGAPDFEGREPINIQDDKWWWKYKWIPEEYRKSPKKEFVAQAFRSTRELREILDEKPLVSMRTVAGDFHDTLERVYLNKDNGKPVRWTNWVGDGTVVERSAANREIPEAAAAITEHATIFSDQSVKSWLRRQLIDVDQPRPISKTGTRVEVETRDGTHIMLRSIEIQVEAPYLRAGATSFVTIKLRDEKGFAAKAVGLKAWLESPPGNQTELEVKETPSHAYRASFVVPALEETHRILVELPPVTQRFAEYFVSLKP